MSLSMCVILWIGRRDEVSEAGSNRIWELRTVWVSRKGNDLAARSWEKKLLQNVGFNSKVLVWESETQGEWTEANSNWGTDSPTNHPAGPCFFQAQLNPLLPAYTPIPPVARGLRRQNGCLPQGLVSVLFQHTANTDHFLSSSQFIWHLLNIYLNLTLEA